MNLRGTVLLVAACLVMWASPRHARACDCVTPPTPREESARVDLVFVGRAMQTDHRPVFQLERGFKGAHFSPAAFRVARVVGGVAGGYSLCNYSFSQGERYLVYATRDEYGWYADKCGRTRRLADAADDLAELGAGWDRFGTMPELHPLRPAKQDWSRGLAIALCAIVVVTAVVVTRK